jgi:hypothetical protein
MDGGACSGFLNYLLGVPMLESLANGMMGRLSPGGW